MWTSLSDCGCDGVVLVAVIVRGSVVIECVSTVMARLFVAIVAHDRQDSLCFCTNPLIT